MKSYEEKLSEIVDICYSHFIYGETQSDIAQRKGISRAKVCKMISTAEQMGIVQIKINDPLEKIKKIEKDLEKKYNLKEARVVPVPSFGAENILARIGKASAELVASYIKRGDIIGISGGTTLFEMIEQFVSPADSKNVVVVPLLGGYGEFEGATHGREIASTLSKKLNAQLVAMPTPGIVESPEEEELFKSNSMVKRGISWIQKCNIAIFGIGTADIHSTFYKGGVLNDTSLNALKKERAVGCICLNFFDSDGNPCRGFNSKIIGVSLEDILSIPLTIGIAGASYEKIIAIKGALAGSYLDILVTDQITAQELLK